MHEALLEHLTPSQRQAVCHREGPLLVLAGPGSGKTRVITHRIAALIEWGVRPCNICAITFTNKAAEEMRQRHIQLACNLQPLENKAYEEMRQNAVTLNGRVGAHISTFHSLCVRILRIYADAAGIHRNFSVYDESDQTRCIKQALKDCDLDTANFPPGRMLEAVSTLKNKLVDPDSFRSQAEDFFSQTLVRVYARYQQILADRNGLDFDDLLMKAALLLEGNSAVCRELSERFTFLLIDEYQDTNHAQYRLAKALVASHDNICATGDPDQSIYRWRGADIRNILAFEKDWPDATIVKLEENFRSTAEVLRAADRLIACNRNRKEKVLVPVRSHKGDLRIDNYEDEEEEANAVAERIDELVNSGVRGNDIAVFYRVNAMSRALEEAFIRHKVPYQVVRGVEFYNRKEIRDVLAYLKVLVNPADEVALQRIINTPTRGIGKVTVDRASTHGTRNRMSLFDAIRNADQIAGLTGAVKAKLAKFVQMIDALAQNLEDKVAPLVERVFEASGLEESLRTAGHEGRDAVENIEQLINTAAAYDQQAQTPSLVDYLQQIALFSDADAYDASNERVALMTLHAAKGLEFENVFIIGLEHGILPHERAGENSDDLEEERRLFFVGVTRAKTNCHISYARYRTVRGQVLRTIPSQFLFELGPGLMHSPAEREHPLRATVPFPKCQPAPSPSNGATAPQFIPGQVVRHKTFGLGRVKKYVDMGANSVVVISFNSGQTKSLLLQYADLVRI
ncbi:MAG: UvrD-helicase domain-containing protein [Sedimentisphaerales bacterium]|nr:UvrD-helicase domain-containing protein [Sedimentisphaerales bacterium]